MSFNLKGRHFLTLKDYTPQEILYLLDLSIELKKKKHAGKRGDSLKGKNIALIFEKPSTRTRCAFVVAANDEGACTEYLGKDEIQLGKKESVKDTARVLGRMFDAIQFRGFAHETVETLAKYSGVPVWNGLTDLHHPTQMLADFMTVMENGKNMKGLKFAYCGDGRNNVANSLMIGSAKLGVDYRVVTDETLFPDKTLLEECKVFCKESGAKITVTTDVAKGVDGADVIYTDVWASMGEESKIPDRIKLLKPYQVNEAMLKKTGNPNVIFLHCLPSFHNHETALAQKFPEICETTEEVFEGRHSKVFDEAENRVHTIKAVMIATLGG